MVKKAKGLSLILVLTLGLWGIFILPCSPQSTDKLTIVTYYPSPYGVYNELRSKRMAIGDNYYKNSDYCWGGGCTNTIDSDADLVVEGNVGIGTESPQTKLDVDGAVKLGSQNTCNADTEGAIRYNSTSKTTEVCDGSSWKVMGGGGKYCYTYYSNSTTPPCTCPAGETNKKDLGTWGYCYDGPAHDFFMAFRPPGLSCPLGTAVDTLTDDKGLACVCCEN